MIASKAASAATMSVKNKRDFTPKRGNRQVYQRLKLALSLGLRRQIFIAVCDDLTLRNHLANRLQVRLTQPLGQKEDFAPLSPHASSLQGHGYPPLVSLLLNLKDPNPLAQITQWFAHNPPPNLKASPDQPKVFIPQPGFQILGVERLTGQPVVVQRLFLNYLQRLGRKLPNRDFSLVLWVSRPWLHKIQQSAPEFWRWRTGVFEFAGEPTPISTVVQSRESGVWSEKEALNGHGQMVTQEASAQEESSFLDNRHDSYEYLPSVDESLEAKVNVQLDTALQDFETRQVLQQIQELEQQQAPSTTLAAAYQRLGDIYRDRLEQGELTTPHVTVAIQAYEQSLNYFDRLSPPVLDILNDLGTLYWMLSKAEANSEQALLYLEHGIEVYQVALNQITLEQQPHTYARIQNNLGAAYGDLARYQHPAQNWQQAVLAYKEALHYRSVEVDPLKYAATQNNLGTAYWHLAQYHQAVPHLKEAITAYSEALLYYNHQQEPLNYAMIQNNIGTAYWNLAQHDQFPTDYLQKAIDAYGKALQYRTPTAMPTACAATQNNLGTAYWYIANQPQTSPQGRQEYLQMCITAYETTISVAQLTTQTLTFDVLATCNNLGLAHYQIATDKYLTLDKSTLSSHLEAALDNHLQALQGWQQQPDYYQTALSYIIQTIRSFYSELGIRGQNLALSKIPSYLLPEVLPRL